MAPAQPWLPPLLLFFRVHKAEETMELRGEGKRGHASAGRGGAGKLLARGTKGEERELRRRGKTIISRG
ncbi:hypothetical protein E2562_012030 [Oryza meyeriana var. granulata]|uniref:Uncharacterized protein n=1 Tax=Oryza meyeriana var. granulata TaxID=110450 RepID=A0A6G1D2K8_9ORYZ|nr:hypothetical protein E2562_012030 [Oryza meyeriana var. granulata]